MRQYRAIPIDGKDFVYGWHARVEGKHYIIPINASYHRYSFTPDRVIKGVIEVIPETVGQFVKIIEGKEIWEGDLLTGHRLPKRDPFIVEWDESIAGFRMPYSYSEKELEVIGTVHTHPEKIKKTFDTPKTRL